MNKAQAMTQFAALCTFIAFSLASFASDNTRLINLARSAAPDLVSADATVMYRGEVLATGSNGWICMPETLADDNAPMCNDATWMEMMKAVAEKAPFSASNVGFSYMLQGDAGVSNSTPYHEDHKSAEDFIREGPHLMVILPKEMLTGITRDPHAGGPYVMWGDTPYAHIMIPIGERPGSN